MKKVVCAVCGLVNLDTFPAFPFCEACGTRLPVLRRFGWRERLRRSALPLVWAMVLGASVALVAFLSLSLAHDTRDRNRGTLVVTGQSVPDTRASGAYLWTLRLRPADQDDDEPLHHVRLRLSLEDKKTWRLSVVSPRPDAVDALGTGRYFGWSVLPPHAAIQLRLLVPAAASSARPLGMLWVADGFAALPVAVFPFSPRTGSSKATPGTAGWNRSH